MDYATLTKEELQSLLTENKRLLEQCHHERMRPIYEDNIKEIEGCIRKETFKRPIKKQ